MNPIYIFDVEIFKNLFTATFINAADEKEEHAFYIGLGVEDYSPLLKFLKQEITLIGYNSISYDCPMLRFLVNYRGDKLLSELYGVSGKLISDGFRSDKEIMELRYPRKRLYPWKSIDLMRILAFDKLGISLKQTAINLKWHRILDLPVKPDAHIQPEQLNLILEYNRNDVLITERLYKNITPLRRLRDELSKIYSVDLSSASDSKMANLILEYIYGIEMKMDIRSIRDMRTKREKVLLGDCITKYTNFQSPELKEMLDRISATIVYDYNYYKYSEKLSFANCKFTLGVGGLHTEDEPGVFVTDDNYIIQDMDVASYYPNLIINNNFYPEHLGIGFIQVLKQITAERLAAKKAKDKVKADGLKITINSIFGKLASENFWLQDAKAFLSTTVNGQLSLLMLVEGLHLNGIHVISCNTDGIVCKIPRELKDRYYEIAHAWEKTTNLELEYTEYKKYIRRDVNSYITEKKDGSTKEKGAFLKEVDLKKAYHMPIVAKALHAYFIKSIPVKETLEKCHDIMEFCISQKTGSNFVVELHTSKGVEKLQKTNRFYITKKGGTLLKRDQTSKKAIGMYVGRLVRALNDYDPVVPFEDYSVDLSFYEKEVLKIVDEIEPQQLVLFDISALPQSSKTKMEIPSGNTHKDEENLSLAELNKLGKNQLSRKLETIAINKQTIAHISPRYVYVTDFDTKSMKASIYCLAKGVRSSLYVDKKAYKAAPFEKGSLVFCNKFEKREVGHTITEYRITEKIEEDEEKLI